MTEPTPDRRRHPRAVLDWPVTLETPEGPCEARLRDVSRIGVCFFVDTPIAEMTVLSMRIELPGGPLVTGSGVVVRCQPLSPSIDHYEVAIFLNEMDDADRTKLDGFVATAPGAP